MLHGILETLVCPKWRWTSAFTLKQIIHLEMEYFSPGPTYPQYNTKLDCQLFQAGHDDPRFSRGDVHVREYTVHMYSSTLSILCDTVKTGSFLMFFRGLSKKTFLFKPLLVTAVGLPPGTFKVAISRETG